MSKPIDQFVFELDGTSVPVIKRDGKLWLSQKSMADLFQIGVSTLHTHICRYQADGEIEPMIIGTRSSRSRAVLHYTASVAIAIASRVTSPRGLQFIDRFPVWAQSVIP